VLHPGTLAPDFALPDHTGRTRRLSELAAEGPLILYFYPADFTPGCTREACDFRDLHAQILGSGHRVVGVSPQSPESHSRFRERYSLPFVLLSDEDRTAIRAYGVDGPLGLGVRRATYLVDRNRRIVDAILADLRVGRHLAFVERAIAAKGDRSATPRRG
jgi:peroxiredoxin Q/BCP